jgi:hypothetical protein
LWIGDLQRRKKMWLQANWSTISATRPAFQIWTNPKILCKTINSFWGEDALSVISFQLLVFSFSIVSDLQFLFKFYLIRYYRTRGD